MSWRWDLSLSFIRSLLWDEHQSPLALPAFPFSFWLYLSHSLSIPLPLAFRPACSFSLPLFCSGEVSNIFFFSGRGKKGAEAKNPAWVKSSNYSRCIHPSIHPYIQPSVHPGSSGVASVITALLWWWQSCRRPANVLLMFVFPYQKKAEEAHRVLEGLGPRVELVSGDWRFNFVCI